MGTQTSGGASDGTTEANPRPPGGRARTGIIAIVFAVLLPALAVVGNRVLGGDAGGQRLREHAVFTDVTAQAAVVSQHGLLRTDTDASGSAGEAPSHEGTLLDTEGAWDYVGTGQAWGDYDNDGWVDLYLTDQTGPNQLYRNQGDGTFARSPIADSVSLASDVSGGAIFVDIDNDGWRDLYVAGRSGGTLLRNDQGRRFVDATDAAEITTDDAAIMGAWADYDGDSLLDLFVATNACFSCRGVQAGEGGQNRLFHNEGDGRFTDATDLVGVPGMDAFTMAAGWFDADDDGDPDLYVASDARNTEFLPANLLMRNDGLGCSGWCFTDVSEEGAGARRDSMGMAVGDYDRDGALDLFVTSVGSRHPITGPGVLLRNAGGSTFSQPPKSGATVDVFGWGTAFLDADNDGWLDLYIGVGDGDPAVSYFGERVQRDRLLAGGPDGTFTDITDLSGTNDPLPTMGLSIADYNLDGWTDLAVGNFDHGYLLYANAATRGSMNHRLRVELTGAGPVNRDAVGARVTVTTSDGRQQTAEVIAGSSLGAGSELALPFGLGVGEVSELEVRWPDGTVESFDDVPADMRWRLTYGASPSSEPLATPGVAATAAVSAPRPGIGVTGLLIPLLTVLTTIGLVVYLVARRRSRDGVATTSLTLLVLWSVGFQVAHFAEHLIQMGYWLAHPSRPLYITPWGRLATFGYAYLAGDHGGQTSGTEFLHLTGNWIFLAGLIAAYLAIRRHELRGRGALAFRIAFFAQAFHVIEHIALTSTWLLLDKPIGLSTLFGRSFAMGGIWAQSFRGWFHFVLNLIPTVAAVAGVLLFDLARGIPNRVRATAVRGHGWIAVDALTVAVAAAAAVEMPRLLFRSGRPSNWVVVCTGTALLVVAVGMLIGLYRRERAGSVAIWRDLAVTIGIGAAVMAVASLFVARLAPWQIPLLFAIAAPGMATSRWIWTLRLPRDFLTPPPAPLETDEKVPTVTVPPAMTRS